MLSFIKMQANGNDFMVLDNWHNKMAMPSPFIIQQWADRQTGVGFDQLVYLSPSSDVNIADCHCRIFNADGTEAGQCGHGMACVAQFIARQGYLKKSRLRILTIAGIWEVEVLSTDEVIVNLGIPIFIPQQIPFIAEQPALFYPIPLKNYDDPQGIQLYKRLKTFQNHALYSLVTQEKTNDPLNSNDSLSNLLEQNEPYLIAGVLSLGNPHCVVLVEDLHQVPSDWGERLSQHPYFPKGTNVEFMQIIHSNVISLRVYERGVGENRACGSGACAAMIFGRLLGSLSKEVTVQFPLGDQVTVQWEGSHSPVYLKTHTHFVFMGEIDSIIL